MALKKLKIKLTQAPPQNGDKVTVQIEGDLVQQYNEASAKIKEAEALMADLRPEIAEVGTGELYKRRCAEPLKELKTVRVMDEKGEVIQVQFTSQYGTIAEGNVDTLDEMFTEAGQDVNAYLQEKVVAKFDDKVFLDETGTFSPKIYEEFRKAVEVVSRRLGVPCPLQTGKVICAKDSFHVERWGLFDAETQVQLTELIPNTVRLVPVTRKA